ncbi:type I glyceraldehyde-3-phosphate dehydrogenase [Williamsoniiplasma lucivorax]|uniref:Glyceraldehyde-3-phosphate dehydrogenase n=1 Tax=Williamsoniiplasma lucivorax TaxID=209274 RepID=A0A2S5RFS5_9MOLU|nr:type I glyceraldehyde-3-phosphate dehydrogenase [Williamsoniiplasma lucivorax]PPE06148.1 glyceraldehyde-3-phosphate dehydrogenase [Williamsoniiplasma lucivorax]
MAKKVAINGFGRIGRLTFRQLWEKGVDIVAINDLTDTKTLAYLLEFDSAHGKFHEGKITFGEGFIIVDGKKVEIFAEKDAANLPWGKLGVDVVIESTGFYTSKDKAEAHIKAGAKKVAISAPATGDLKTIVYGVNHKDLTNNDTIISGASCTTNCLVPMVKVLDDAFGIEKGLMTTIHAVTNDQKLLDLPHSDLRRGRAAAWNIVPTTTGAAVAVSLVLPNMKGKLDGYSLRVPMITGSITDLSVELNKNVTVQEVNQVVKDAVAKNKDLGTAMEYNERGIVSSDIIGSHFGSIFDGTLTKVVEVNGKQMVKVFSWYDNESSYTSQLVRTVIHWMSL